jgi:hypothetical protein
MSEMEQVTPFMTAKKLRERERRGQGLTMHFKGTPPVTTLSSIKSHLLNITLPPNTAKGW